MPAEAVLRPISISPTTGSVGDGRTRARLAYHKAILESLGITDLGTLGTLPISGQVVPQPGLTVPSPRVLGRETAFQGALRAATNGAARAGGDGVGLEVTGGTARLVEVVLSPLELVVPSPELADPSLREIELVDWDLPTDGVRRAGLLARGPEATARAIMPIDTAYWAATWVDLAAGTTVVFKQPCRYLTIITEKLTVGANVSFTWEKPQLPIPPKLGKPAKPPQAPTPDGLWGVTGTPGTAGVRGGTGANGLDAPELEIWLLELTGEPAFVLNGQEGGRGGAGQDGGDGGDGSKGRHELYDFFGFCKSGPGNGGDGGPGGRAGDGGPGGHGGHGGRLSFYAPQPVLSTYTSRFYVTVDGGASGPGGSAGVPGAGGFGGQVGDSPKNCAPSTPRLAGKPGPQGAAGLAGPAGQTGGHHLDGIGFYPITVEQFREALTRPAITNLSPNRAKQGDLVTVAGRRFAPGATILIEGVEAPTTVVSDTMLTFQVPVVQGGQRLVQLRLADGTLSSRATLYVVPVVSATEQGSRIRPGTKVTLVGSGFAQGARVRVNDHEMPDVTFVDPNRLTFTFVRPSLVTRNPAGEPVSLSVILADGTPSNTIPLVLDTFRILVLGDSVQWGQGLAEEQKFHSLVQVAVQAGQGNIGVYKEVLAHSGAKIGVGDATTMSAIHGEVPTFYPTILQQCDSFTDEPATVDLVLVDGGINDVDVRRILDPNASADAIRKAIERHCHVGMKALLKKITDKFTNAQVVVTGYFPIVSDQTNLEFLRAFLIAVGIAFGGAGGGVTGGVLSAQVKKRLVATCKLFAEQSTAKLRAAVNETNRALGGQPRVFFAVPPFGPANSVLAPDPWLWGVNADSSPQDNLVAGSRWEICNANATRCPVVVCSRASAGHPNPRGANEYAKAILAALSTGS